MKIQKISGTDGEKIFGVFKNVEATLATKDSVAQLDFTTTTGLETVQPNTGQLLGAVGIYDQDIPTGQVGLVQLYGFRGTAKVRMTDTTIAAGAGAVAVASQDYIQTSTLVHPWFVVLETHATGTTTTSKKVFIRAL